MTTMEYTTLVQLKKAQGETNERLDRTNVLLGQILVEV